MFGTFEQFKAAQEETKQEEPESAIAIPQQTEQLDQAQDMNIMKATDGQEVSSVEPRENQSDESMIGDQESFRDITPQLKRCARTKSKSKF